MAADVAELLLDLVYGLEVGRTVESIPTHEQVLDNIAGDVAPRDVKPPHEVGEREAIEDNDHASGETFGQTRAEVHERGAFVCVLEWEKKAGDVPCT